MTKGNLFKKERISGEKADLSSPEIFLKTVRENINGSSLKYIVYALLLFLFSGRITHKKGSSD